MIRSKQKDTDRYFCQYLIHFDCIYHCNFTITHKFRRSSSQNALQKNAREHFFKFWKKVMKARDHFSIISSNLKKVIDAREHFFKFKKSHRCCGNRGLWHSLLTLRKVRNVQSINVIKATKLPGAIKKFKLYINLKSVEKKWLYKLNYTILD
jgi:hypothetical protein